MNAEQFARQIRQARWDHFDGRIDYQTRCEREDRLWDRAYEAGGAAMVQDVERALTTAGATVRTA